LELEVHARGGGKPTVHLEAAPAPVVKMLQPPGASTWAAAIRRRSIPPADLLSRLIGARFRLVRADQFQAFLADPDSDGHARAVYAYETVAAPPRHQAGPVKDGGGTDALLVALLIVGSLVVVGGGLVAWAHS
jgi:hypothetical protein